MLDVCGVSLYRCSFYGKWSAPQERLSALVFGELVKFRIPPLLYNIRLLLGVDFVRID